MNPTSSSPSQVRVKPIDWDRLEKKDAQAISRSFQRTHPIDLKTAIIEANTHEKLLYLSKHLHAGLSFWGYQYVYASPESLCTGTARIKELFEEIRHLQIAYIFNGEPEYNRNPELDGEMDRIAFEDLRNCKQANLLTTICRLVVGMIFSMDHQQFWEEYRRFGESSNKKE